MEYTVAKLARLSGVSSRTLRYYDSIGLLQPQRLSSSGYRIYGAEQVDRLQQILFYRELELSLEEIKKLLDAADFDPAEALEQHLSALLQKQERLELLIHNVEKSIRVMKGEDRMSDQEKFEGFKQKLIDDNETHYGDEIREKYGDETVDRSNAKLKGMSREQYQELEQLSQKLNDTLKAALATGDPAGKLAQQACVLHREWLCYYWSEYSPEAHMGLGQMYVDDERFKAYYEVIGTGAAEFLRDALNIYCTT